MKKLLAALGVGALTALVPATLAGAAPTGATNSQQITIVCSGGISTTAVTNGNGNWTPAHLADGRVVQPLSFDILFTNITQGQSFEEVTVKNNVDQATVECRFRSGVFTDPGTGDQVQFVGSAKAVVHPG